MSIKQFTKQSILYSFGFILSRLQVFLLLPVLVNCLNAKEYGIYETLSTLIVLSTTICVFNLDSGISSFFHKTESQNDKKDLCSTAFLLMLGWIGLLLLIVFMSKSFLSRLIFNFEIASALLLKTFLIGALQGLVHFLNVLLRQKFQAIRYNVLVFIQTLPLLIAVTFFYRQGQLDLNKVLDIFIATNLLALIAGLFLNADLLGFHFQKKLLDPLLNIALPLLPFSVFAWGLSLSDRILLSHSLGVEQVAIYAFANRIASISSVLQGPFQIAWPPYALKLLAEKKESLIFQKAMGYFILAAGALVIFLGFAAPFIFALMAPKEYIDSSKFVGLLAFCTMMNSLYYFPLTIFLHHQKTWASTFSFFLAAAVNISINLFVTPKVGMIGAVYANLFSYFVLTGMAFYLSNRFHKTDFNYKKNVALLVAIFAIVFLSSLN